MAAPTATSPGAPPNSPMNSPATDFQSSMRPLEASCAVASPAAPSPPWIPASAAISPALEAARLAKPMMPFSTAVTAGLPTSLPAMPRLSMSNTPTGTARFMA